VVAVCLGVVVTRAIWQGRSALARGDVAAAAGRHREAIEEWGRAARWYLPGAPHVGRAYDRLEALARAAEARGERDIALAAWRRVRGSILATRSFYTPHAARLAPANRRIAALMAAVEGAAADPGRSEAERAAWHLQLLDRSPGPSVGWSLLALVGFALWLGGAVLFALRGLPSDDRLDPAKAAWAGAMVAVGLVVWLLGLYNA
jgi:hypothetical protein